MSLMNLEFRTEICRLQKLGGTTKETRRLWSEVGSYSETLIVAWIPRIPKHSQYVNKIREFLLVHPAGKEAQLISFAFLLT